MEGVGIGGSTSAIFYFPTGFTFNAYSKYGPTPDDPFNHWYEFIYSDNVGAEIDENIITLHFVDGEKGDDDLVKNGVIIDIGGPGNRAKMSPEPSSRQINGNTDTYGCFIETLY